jgi:hypothetical protein
MGGKARIGSLSQYLLIFPEDDGSVYGSTVWFCFFTATRRKVSEKENCYLGESPPVSVGEPDRNQKRVISFLLYSLRPKINTILTFKFYPTKNATLASHL